MTKTEAPRERAWEKKQRQNEPIVAYVSKTKMMLMAAPCLLASGVAAYALYTDQNILGGDTFMHAAAGVVGAVTAFVLLQMGFDRKPSLVIDETGVTCRQPNTGTIPWHAILGIGYSRGAIFRKMLMLAVDESALDENAKKHVKRRGGLLGGLAPRVGQSTGDMRNNPTINISIAYFTISIRELDRQISEKIHFHGR